MGNRGVLHDPSGRIVRDCHVRRWIACRLEFRGRKRAIMQPGRYTELFFLDEATALAAGHRPCAECRHADFVTFMAAWRRAHAHAAAASVDEVDRQLHAERRDGPWRQRTHAADLAAVPDGAFIARDGHAWLVLGKRLLRWTAGGYIEPAPRPTDGREVTLLTPPSIVAVLRAGYQPLLHPTASAGA